MFINTLKIIYQITFFHIDLVTIQYWIWYCVHLSPLSFITKLVFIPLTNPEFHALISSFLPGSMFGVHILGTTIGDRVLKDSYDLTWLGPT